MEEDKLDLEHGAGLGMLTLNRKPNAAGVSHGGVAITFRKSFCSMSRIPAKNPDNFEVLPAVGTIPGHRRKLVVFACYIPPSYDTARGKKCLEYISDMVCVSMRKYNDPYIIVSGDFNQWDIQNQLADYQLSLIHI